MSEIPQELKKLVVKEAKALRKYATQEEKNNLDANFINEKEASMCIYGQMTGCCYSSRSIELLNKCAVPFTSSLHILENTTSNKFSDILFSRDFSPIEYYITLPDAKISDLIGLIKS